jgi:hypothetical protein
MVGKEKPESQPESRLYAFWWLKSQPVDKAKSWRGEEDGKVKKKKDRTGYHACMRREGEEERRRGEERGK